MKQWTNLQFILRKGDGSTLELGIPSSAYPVHSRAAGTGVKFPIVKDNKLFDSLLTFEASHDERKIPIEVYINNISDTHEFQNFFEVSRYNQKYKYMLEIYANGVKYNSTVTTEEKPYEVTQIDDLFGTETQPTATIKLELIMDTPFFYSDFTYDYEIGAGEYPKTRYPLPFRLGDDVVFVASEIANLIPHVVDNKGNEDNGVIITIESGKGLKNPRIINETTGFEMGFDLETGLNDIIRIDTIEKQVFVNGDLVLNVKKLFDKWLLLVKGFNVLKFEAAAGGELCRVRVQFYNKYRAIGGGIQK